MSTDNGKVFNVESVLRKCQRNGKKFYLVKWEGFPASHNSWEPAKNLRCWKEIREFNRMNQITVPGFRDDTEPTEITGAAMKNGKMLFQMKWENGAPDSFVYATEANERYAQIVIQYYETKWHQARSMSKQYKTDDKAYNS